MNLSQLQALMWRAITWPTGVADFLAQADAETREQFASAFAESTNFDASARMEVYANAYYWRLHGVLVENFPTVAWLLGETGYRNLLTDYLLAHPSTDPDLRHLGAALPDYLESHPATRAHPALAQIARAEAAMGEILHAADHESVDRGALSRLAPVTWPSLRLRFSPTLRVLPCDWSLDTLTAQRAQGREAPALTSIAVASPGRLLIWRQGFRVKRRRAALDETRAIQAFQRGDSFGELCATLAVRVGDGTSLTSLPATLASWIGSWVDSGLLCAIEVDPAPPER